MRRIFVCVATVALGVLAVTTGPAWAQYRGYGYGYEGGDANAYDPFFYPDSRQAPPREPSYYPAPGADPYASPYGGRQAPTYVDPQDGGRGGGGPASDTDLGASVNRRTMVEVENPTKEAPGTIVIDTASRHLYLVEPNGRALQYGIGVGREGFAWHGTAKIERKAEWPDWIPPGDMLKRRPDLPLRMAGGIENPLGARALYLYQGNRDTLFRIHGTNEPDTIGKAVSSGCIRMMNGDVIDLYQRVPVGTKVKVL